MISNGEKWFGDVLEENYSPETSDDEKTCIHSMIRRLKLIFNCDLEEDDSLFNKDRGPEIITNLMTSFNQWKSLIDESNSPAYSACMQHFVIYTIAKLCFYYWIRESEIVTDILRRVYICDGHFSSMFNQIMNQNNRRWMWIAPNQETRQKEYLTIMYFLIHAHRTKLEFSGVRFVDLRLRVPLRAPPVFSAAIYSKPHLLLLLLRHGAILDPRQTGGQSDGWDLNMMLRHLIRIMWASFGMENDESSWDMTVVSSAINDVCQCFRYLLRGIRQIPMGELDFSLLNFDASGLTVSSNSHDFIRLVSERGIIPCLKSRYFEPSELRHLCRLAIREDLNRNWNLPSGIFSLPLPKALQNYVNVSED